MFLIFMLVSAEFLFAQDTEYHGADSVFETEGIAVFWAVLKGSDIDSSKVYINIVPENKGTVDYSRYSVVLANVFTKEEEVLVDYQLLEDENIIIQNYRTFYDKSKRRLLFFKPDDSGDRPSMEIYYVGVPDTAPEFLLEEHIRAFFDHSIKMIRQ